MGAFVQTTFDGIAKTNLILDNTDIRLADQGSLADQQFIYGLSANNSPTVSDPWNTLPAWSLPASSSGLAPTPAAGTLIESLAGQVGGITAYMMWNNLLYVESGGYTSLPRNVQQTVNSLTRSRTGSVAVRPTGASRFSTTRTGTMGPSAPSA
jgi:hypothetical protein